jgi:hypothetical protein
MLTKKYFDEWLKELDNQYIILSTPQMSLLDCFISGGNHNDRSHLAAGAILGEIVKVRALRDELESKGLLT